MLGTGWREKVVMLTAVLCVLGLTCRRVFVRFSIYLSTESASLAVSEQSIDCLPQTSATADSSNAAASQSHKGLLGFLKSVHALDCDVHSSKMIYHDVQL